MFTVHNREALLQPSPYSPYSKDLPHFSAGELMLSAIAEGHGDRPGKALDVICSSCRHSRVCVTLLCCLPGAGDRSRNSAGSQNREVQDGRTGVHLWKCFHRFSELISRTARTQPPCHEAFFLLNLFISGPAVASLTATGQAKQRECGAPLGTGGHPNH